MLYLTFLTFMVLDHEKFEGTAKACQDLPQSITVDSNKDLGQVYESCIQTYILFSAFLLYPVYLIQIVSTGTCNVV